MSGALATLVKRGHISQALDFARRLSTPSPEERVLQCELEALTSNRDAALRIATAVIAGASSPESVIRALLVAGRIDFYNGRYNEGQQRFARAQELAAKQEKAHLGALAIGRHIEALLRFVNLEAAVGHISEYRRAALRVGTAQSLGTLHRILAEAELKSGRSHRALRELGLARSHGDVSDDLYSEAQLELAHSAAHGLLGDVGLAHQHASRAADLARRVGALALLKNALTNVAHCQVLLGHCNQAASTLSSIGALARGTEADLDVRATELMLATATRDSQLAHRIDAECSPIASSTPSVAAHWYKLAQATHLIVSGRAAEAAVLTNSCLKAVGSRFDRSYVDRTLVVSAEALALCGAPRPASDALSTVVLGPQGHLAEFIASTQRAQGLVASDSIDTAFDHFSRAARIYGHIGHVSGRGESLHSAATLRATLTAIEDSPAVLPPLAQYETVPLAFGRVETQLQSGGQCDAARQTIRATAAMVDLASRPALSGYELLSLIDISAAGCAVLAAGHPPAAKVLGWVGSTQPDRSLLAHGEDTISIPLGIEDNRDVYVTVRPTGEGATRTTLIALRRLAANAQSLQRLAKEDSERSALWPDPLPEQQLGLVCTSESMLQLLSAARRVATSDFSILITGETGTGKELLARAIHFASHRREQRFQPFNCSAVSRDMLDSQLFGYRRGAFTGAHDSFPGVIRNAIGGTLMLDEIGEISLDVQPKLLRFLESNEIHPLGEPSPINVDVRVVAATNANLEKLVEEGRFREDLFYRLNVVQLTIPPLRERREEIPLLLDHFLDRTQRECGKSGMRIGDTAAEYLLLYNWPGNVRELANEVRRAVAMAESGAVLMPEHLSTRVTSSRRTVPASQRPVDDSELVVRRDQPLTAAVEHVERALIQDALRAYPNVEDAARALGLSRKGLYLKRQRLKLDE